MPPLPKGICPDCGRTVALRVGGQTREHYPPKPGTPPRGICVGSGKQARS